MIVARPGLHPLTILIVLAAARGAIGFSTFIETFDGGSNEGGWRFETGSGSIQPAGGNPGAYFRDTVVDTFAPQPRTTLGLSSQFTGDFRTRQVTAIGIDLITHSVDFSAAGRPLTLMLISDNGTPGDFNDDWAAYDIGPDNVPLPGQGWMSYDYDVPSQSMTLPAGWNTIAFGPNSPANPDWNDVITDVAQIRFFYGDPELFFIFQQWDLGLDNPRITTADPTPVPAMPSWGAVAIVAGVVAAGCGVWGRMRNAQRAAWLQPARTSIWRSAVDPSRPDVHRDKEAVAASIRAATVREWWPCAVEAPRGALPPGALR